MTYRTRRPRGPWHRYGGWHGHGNWHSHGDSHGHGDWHGHGRRRFGSREDLISALERYQRDLEQRAADVAEKIRGLRAKGSGETEDPEGSDATPTTRNI